MAKGMKIRRRGDQDEDHYRENYQNTFALCQNNMTHIMTHYDSP